MDVITPFLIDEEDIAYEYELQKTPQSIITWGRYLESWNAKRRPLGNIIWLYERFCSQFQDQADIWEEYMQWAISKQEFDYVAVFERFEKVLQNFRGRCDSLCLKILEFAINQYDLEMIRKTVDLCLVRIPRDSHGKIWEPILALIDDKILPLTAEHDESKVEDDYEEIETLIYQALFGEGEGEREENGDIWSSYLLQRYISVAPHWNLEESLNKLALTGDYKAVHQIYVQYLSQNKPFTPHADISYSMHLNYLIALEKLGLDGPYESFVERMHSVFPEKKLDLILLLCKHHIKQSNFAQLTEDLEKAMQNAVDLKMFTTIYEFNVLFERLYLETIVQELKANPGLDYEKFGLQSHLDHLENLVESHSLRMNEFQLRLNSNLVESWHQRIRLFSTLEEKSKVYAEAILTIDPMKVTVPGSFGVLWCDYAQLYWNSGNHSMAREIWDRSLRVPFPHLQDLETIWSSWTEHELESGNLDRGIQILETALQLPDSPELTLDNYRKGNKKVPAQSIVFTSLTLWSLYLDLEEALSSSRPEHVTKTISIYEQAIALKVATPLYFINYAHFLQEHGPNILDSFRIYERAISIFPPETQYEIWNIYLAEATDPSAQLSQESIRDLFDHALESLVPSGIDCRPIFVLYSNFEEKNGFVKRSVDILLRGCRGNSISELWAQCVSKAKHLLGGEAARPYYEECLKSVPNSRAIPFVLQFADSEAQQGEMERAREILKYGAQLQPPVNNSVLWEFWEEFEVQNGDKESYKSMLKLRRKLETEMVVDTEMESQQKGNVQFVASSTDKRGINPEEIDLNI